MYYELNKDNCNGNRKIYDSITKKVYIIKEEDFYINMRLNNVFGYKPNKERENQYINEIFLIGRTIYYIYNQVVIVYINNKAKLYNISNYNTIQNDNRFFSLDFDKGKVTLGFIMPNLEYIDCVSTSKKNLVKEISISREDFLQNYKAIACKYLLLN